MGWETNDSVVYKNSSLYLVKTLLHYLKYEICDFFIQYNEKRQVIITTVNLIIMHSQLGRKQRLLKSGNTSHCQIDLYVLDKLVDPLLARTSAKKTLLFKATNGLMQIPVASNVTFVTSQTQTSFSSPSYRIHPHQFSQLFKHKECHYSMRSKSHPVRYKSLI